MDKFEFRPEVLLYSEPFQELLHLQQTVNPFEVFGIASDELAHSRILARLLSSDGPLGFGHLLIPRILAELSKSQHWKGLQKFGKLDTELLIQFSSARFRAFTEYSTGVVEDIDGRIDILLVDEHKKLFLAIENKIYAYEQKHQILRYQQYLQNDPRWSGYRGLILYLTPEGSKSNTNDETSSVPYLPISYLQVALVLKSILDQDHSHVVQHLYENIRKTIMEESEEKKLVAELFKNEEIALAIHIINKHRPKLGDIFEKLKIRIADNRLDGVYIWPEKRGDTTEIWFSSKKWTENGLPIQFVFYQGSPWPVFRVMARVEKFNLKAWNDFASNYPDVFHVEPIQRKDWNCWYVIMKDENDDAVSREKSYVRDLSYSQDVIEKLLEKFDYRYKQVSKCVNEWLETPRP